MTSHNTNDNMPSNDAMTAMSRKWPNAISQDEMILSHFNFGHCFNCRLGPCIKHPALPPSALAQTQEQTRRGLQLLSQLPPELACQVALRLPIRTLFSLSHKNQLDPNVGAVDVDLHNFWATQKDYLTRKLLDEVYAPEAAAFPPSLFCTCCSSVTRTTERRLLYLEAMRACTVAVVQHFTATLALPPAVSARLHAAVLRLWRVFGDGSRHGIAASRRRQTALTYFCSMPQAERGEICQLIFEELAGYIERADPVLGPASRDGGTSPWPWADVTDEEMAMLRRCGAWDRVLGYLALENVRVATRCAFAKAAGGEEVDAGVVAAAMAEAREVVTDPMDRYMVDAWPDRRDGRDGGDNDDGDPADAEDDVGVFIIDGLVINIHNITSSDDRDVHCKWIFTDPWTYGIQLPDAADGDIKTDTPRGHSHRDIYVDLVMASRLPDGWALDVMKFDQDFGEHVTGGYFNYVRRACWWFKRDEEGHGWLNQEAKEEDEMMAMLMDCAFELDSDNEE